MVVSTNEGATKEQSDPSRFSDTIEKSVWYAYTAPENGFREIFYDTVNGAGGNVILRPYELLQNYFSEILSKELLSAGGTKTTRTIPTTRGQKLKLLFDTSSNVGSATPGAFAFSYAFKTGGRIPGGGLGEGRDGV